MDENPIKINDSANGKCIICPDYFDISLAAQLHQMLCEVMQEKPARIELDGQNIEIIDTSILQTLCAFFRDASSAGISVSWINVNDVLCRAALVLGLTAPLHLQSE